LTERALHRLLLMLPHAGEDHAEDPP
jgi:hypothetical protein